MDLWDRAGLAPASWQPPRAFLQSLGASWSEAVALSLPIVDLHYRSRFAGEVPTSTQLGDVRQRLERLRILLRRPH